MGASALKVTSCFTILVAASLLQVVAAQEILNITVIESEGFCEWDASTKDWVGFIPDIVKELGRVATPRFTPRLERVGDGRYGTFEEGTKTWNGLIGEVISGKAQMAAAPLTRTAGREAHIDFTHEVLEVGLVTIAQPQRQVQVTRSAGFFISIFDAGVWISAILAFFVTSLLLFVNYRLNPREEKQSEQQQQQQPLSVANVLGDRSDFSFLGSLLFVVSTGCFQGYKSTPRSLAGRSLTITWWLFAAVFAVTYTAGMVCGLVGSQARVVNSAVTGDPRRAFSNNALALDSLVPVWLPGGSTDRTMNTSSDPLFREFNRLYQRFSKTDDRLSRITRVSDIIDLLKKDARFFGVMESDMALLQAARSGCQLVASPALLNDKSYAFALAESSKWTRIVNHAILQIRESGFVSEAYRRHFGSVNGMCPTLASGAGAGVELASMFHSSLPVTLAVFSGPLILFGLGLLLSLVAAVVDAVVFARFERYQRPPQSADDARFGRLAFSDDQEPVVGPGST